MPFLACLLLLICSDFCCVLGVFSIYKSTLSKWCFYGFAEAVGSVRVFWWVNGGFWWRECCPVLGRLGAGAGMRFVWARAVRAVLLRAFLGALGLMLQAVTTYFCGQSRISAKKLCCVTAFLA